MRCFAEGCSGVLVFFSSFSLLFSSSLSPQSSPRAPPELPQRSPRATPELPQSYPEAPPELPQSSPRKNNENQHFWSYKTELACGTSAHFSKRQGWRAKPLQIYVFNVKRLHKLAHFFLKFQNASQTGSLFFANVNKTIEILTFAKKREPVCEAFGNFKKTVPVCGASSSFFFQCAQVPRLSPTVLRNVKRFHTPALFGPKKVHFGE